VPPEGVCNMAKKTKATFEKRQKEKMRQQRQKDKEAQRLLNRERRATTGPRLEGEDPDLAGIVPGPQPLPEQWRHADEFDNPPTESPEETP
jgi:hypothetical protein